MTNDIAQTLEGFRSRVATAREARARAEAEHARAERDKTEALTTLKEEFSVESLTQAVELLRSMEADLQKQIEATEQALTEAQA